MDRVPGSFDISILPFGNDKELALQLIEGKWDGVFQVLLRSILSQTKIEDTSFENAQKFREALLSDSGVSKWTVFRRLLDEFAKDTTLQIGRVYLFDHIEKVLPLARGILTSRGELQRQALESATQDAAHRVIMGPGSIARITDAAQGHRGEEAAHIRAEAQIQAHQIPPSIDANAWVGQEQAFGKFGSFYVDTQGKEIRNPQIFDTQELNAVVWRDLRGNEFILSKTLEKRLQESSQGNISPENGALIEQILLVITGASEHLSIEDQWNAILKYKLPLKIVTPLLITHKYAGLLYWLFVQFPDVLDESAQVASLKIIKDIYPQNAAKLILTSIEKNISSMGETAALGLLELLKTYSGSEQRILGVLTKAYTQLSIGVFLYMLELCFGTQQDIKIFESAGLVSMCAQKIAALPEDTRDQQDTKSKYCEMYLGFLVSSIRKRIGTDASQGDIAAVLANIKQHFELVKKVPAISDTKDTLLDLIVANGQNEAFTLGLIREKTTRSMSTLWINRKTGEFEWDQ